MFNAKRETDLSFEDLLQKQTRHSNILIDSDEEGSSSESIETNDLFDIIFE